MRFGLALPNSGPIARPETIARVAELAEAAGFDAVLVHDHISYDSEWLGHRTSGLAYAHDAIAPDLYESLITLSWVARATRTVKLGTAVLVLPLRDPRVLARQLLSLQALSGGRVQLGIGSGDYPADYRVMQIDYRSRARRTREYVDVLLALLAGGHVDVHGETVTVERGAFFPVVAPVPLLVGGGIRPSPATGEPELFMPALRLVARRCEGWIPEGPAALVGLGRRRIEALASEAGRTGVSFEVRAQSPLYIGVDDDAAMARVGRGLTHELVGTAVTVRDRLARYADVGVDAMNLRCFADDEASYFAMIDRFATEIMPDFADSH